MRFAFMAKYRWTWPVAWLCHALDESQSGCLARLLFIGAPLLRLLPGVGADHMAAYGG